MFLLPVSLPDCVTQAGERSTGMFHKSLVDSKTLKPALSRHESIAPAMRRQFSFFYFFDDGRNL